MANYLLSTNWHQSSPYNLYCPQLPGGSKTLTGCVATACAQIVNYWLEKGYTFDLRFNSDDIISLYDYNNDKIIEVNASNVWHYCGTTYDELNSILASYRLDGNYNKEAFQAALSLLMGSRASSIYDATYGTSAFAFRSIFTSIGFESINAHQVNPLYYAEGGFSELGFEILGNCVLNGEVIYVDMWLPAHAAVIDGYDPVQKLMHINWGWGGGSNGWYTRQEMNDMALDMLMFDLYPVYDGNPVIISNTNGSGEGSFHRALEKSDGIQKVNKIVFDPAVAGKKIVVSEGFLDVSDVIFPDFNADVRVQANKRGTLYNLSVSNTVFEKFSGSFACSYETVSQEYYYSVEAISYEYEALLEIEDLSGTLIINTPNKEETYALANHYYIDSCSPTLTLTMNGGGIFSGTYLDQNSTYAASVDTIQTLLNTYSDWGGALDQRLINAADGAIAILCNFGDDEIIMNNRSLIAGGVVLGDGNNTLELNNKSVITGDVDLYNGDSTLSLSDGSQIWGDILFSYYKGDTTGKISIDSSSMIHGTINTPDIEAVISITSTPGSDYLLKMGDHYSSTGEYTIYPTAEMTAGTYKLAEDQNIQRRTVVLKDKYSQEEYTLTESNRDDLFNYYGYYMQFSGFDNGNLTLTVTDSGLSSSKNGIDYTDIEGEQYNVEYSRDNFKTVLNIETTENTLDTFGLPEGTYQWKAYTEDDRYWGKNIISDNTTTPQELVSNSNGAMDVFFVKVSETWTKEFFAQRYMSDGNSAETVPLEGKNRIADIYCGSTDSNVLVMTDDSNGDALFTDDIFTALGDQVRLSQIDEIRSGAGDDIVDLTSLRYESDNGGIRIYGGLGNDIIWTDSGNNTLFGDGGNDRLAGDSGNDIIIGGSGDDTMHGGGGNDIFCFGSNFGSDIIEQVNGGNVTLWFESGSESSWNAETMTYFDGTNLVQVTGTSADNISLKFGGDISGLPDGVFLDAASEKIFEDKSKGMIA